MLIFSRTPFSPCFFAEPLGQLTSDYERVGFWRELRGHVYDPDMSAGTFAFSEASHPAIKL